MQNVEIDRQKKLERAKKRVAELKKFYSGLMSYVVVIAALATVNYFVDQWRYPWFLWAAFGWGIGIVFQAIKLFARNPFFNRNWEKRKIKEYMDKDRNI